MTEPITYADAGVDIDAGNAFVKMIKPLVKATSRPEVIADIGGFGGLFSLNAAKYKGKLYGLPSWGGIHAELYNTDLVKAAGEWRRAGGGDQPRAR